MMQGLRAASQAGHGPVRRLRVSITNVLVEHIKAHLIDVWKGNKRNKRIGLAISGGVDSMALATLCAGVRPRIKQGGRLQAFIVDHGYRKGSAVEAVQVAEELQRLEIPSRILTLEWGSQDPTAVTNFETAARALRFQALGRACHEEDIEDLLMAHHGDDAAETILTRILAGYVGTGLAGINSEHNISSCTGIYGVDRSGRPRAPEAYTQQIMIEGGGVKIHRPFLTFRKKALVEVCEKAGTTWFEDPTNKLSNLTTRNTVRSIYYKKLPVALRHAQLLSMAERIQKRQQDVDERVEKLFENMSATLDLRFGTLNVSFHEKTNWAGSSTSTEAVYRVQANLLRRLLHLVSPKDVIPLQSLHGAIDFVFGASSEPTDTSDEKPQSLTIADVQLTRLPSTSEFARQNFLFHRALPPRTAPQDDILEAFDLSVPPGRKALIVRRTHWHLWDSRYWIRISYSLSDQAQSTKYAFQVKHLTPQMVGHLVRRLQRGNTTRQLAAVNLKRILNHISWDIKQVLPVVFAVGEGNSEIIGLPTLGWVNPNWPFVRFQCDIRYKAVDYAQTIRHQLLSIFDVIPTKEEARSTEKEMESLGSGLMNA